MLGTRSCFLFLLITSPFVSFLKKPLQNNVISNVIFSNCFQTWYFFLFPLFPSYWISWFSWISSLQLSPSVSCFSLSLTRCFFASRVIKAHYDRNKKKINLKEYSMIIIISGLILANVKKIITHSQSLISSSIF